MGQCAAMSPEPGGEWPMRLVSRRLALPRNDGVGVLRCGEDLLDFPLDVEAAHLLEIGRRLSWQRNR
jgi:hypothetical protein